MLQNIESVKISNQIIQQCVCSDILKASLTLPKTVVFITIIYASKDETYVFRFTADNCIQTTANTTRAQFKTNYSPAITSSSSLNKSILMAF